MARYFDAQAALAEIQTSPIRPNHPISDAETDTIRVNSTNRVPPDTDAFEERAAICEYDGGYSREHAEDLAARSQGYNNVVAFRAAQQKLRGTHE